MSLWQNLLNGEPISALLSEIVEQMDSHSSDFPVEARHALLNVLIEPHEPKVWLLACVIFGHMCNKSTEETHKLARDGLLPCVAAVLKESFSSLAVVSSEERSVYEELVSFIMSLIHHFARGSSLCVRKVFQYDVLETVLSAIDVNSALYESGSCAFL